MSHSDQAEQMSSSDQTTDETGNVTEAVTEAATEAATEEMSTADVTLDPAASSHVQEDVVEPMELDQQIAIPTNATTTSTTIIPTGNKYNKYPLTCNFSIYCLHIIELQCLPQRAALIKSILNFFKKAIPDPTFAENIRNC